MVIVLLAIFSAQNFSKKDICSKECWCINEMLLWRDITLLCQVENILSLSFLVIVD